MIRILSKSTSPCLQCGTKIDTAVVKGADFSAVLCKEHAWGHVPSPDKKEVGNGQPPRTG
jgi:hypothetical protein